MRRPAVEGITAGRLGLRLICETGAVDECILFEFSVDLLQPFGGNTAILAIKALAGGDIVKVVQLLPFSTKLHHGWLNEPEPWMVKQFIDSARDAAVFLHSG